MVKRSKKSKSKRVTLRKKYKVIRKVKEHHKKKAKDAKKLPRRPKVEKDPGIPSEWPFRDQELKALEARRARAIEELDQKKAARKEKAQKRKLGLLDNSQVTDKKVSVVEEGNSDESIHSIKKRDNSEKAFYKELVKVIEESDVIVEVLDARDPLGTRCVNMEKMVMKARPHKRLVLLLNKIDLVPREAVEKWLKYLREELPTVAFRCSTQEQRSNLAWKSSKAKSMKDSNQTSDCLGAEALMKLLNNYSRSHEVKKMITVGIVGLPNAGKSSLINSLKRRHAVDVGATPGLTRSMQEVSLDKNIKLLDCPGVVMLESGKSDAAIALRNCKRIEKLEDPIGPVKEILKLCPERMLVTIYKVPSFDSVEEFLLNVAMVRGKLKKGGVADIEAAARIILYDWNQGKISYYTMPPSRNQGEPLEANIVSEFSKEFNVDEVYGTETSFIGSLKSADSVHYVEVPPNCSFSFDEKMNEDDTDAPPPDQSGKELDEMSDGDQSIESKEDAGEEKPKNDPMSQNKKLYAEKGIFNPKLQRALKKRRKRDNKLQAKEDAMDDDDDYDFKVDYSRSGSAIGGDSKTDNDAGKNETGAAPMSGMADN